MPLLGEAGREDRSRPSDRPVAWEQEANQRGESMDKATVYTKTAKGITQVNQRSASLSKDLMKVLKLIDGKSNFGQLLEKADIDKGALEKALITLAKDGFARVFETRKEEADPFAAESDDFDFTKAAPVHPGSTQRVVPAAANDVAALAAQQAKGEADRKAKEAAHEQARLRAKAEAESRAKLEAEARAKGEAERQAMEQAQRAKEASERARSELESKMREEEARKKALAEQQAKLAAEHKAKEEGEVRRLAEMRAKAEQEANARAKAELEAKVREEEARRKTAAEAAAKTAAEQRAKEEVEARRLAEMRVKAEMEAKALAEARSRAEAEAAALAKARAEAEAAVKKQAAEASNAEAAMKARLKEEIEARIRGEMEELLRTETAEKTEKSREEMKAEIMAEARLAAKAELEERLREEREHIAQAEAEARARADQDAKARAEIEAKKRAEAEARAVAEAAGRAKAEAEARELRARAETQQRQSDAQAAELRAKAEEQAKLARDAEARMRVEAEARAREQAEVNQRIEAERRGKYEAEARAKIEAEESDKRRRELEASVETERKAKEEAEMRARIEARARETVAEDTRAKVQAELESDMAKRAEIEGKAQAKAYMQAKVKAEADEDERLRAEQARKAAAIAEVLRTKVEPDEKAPEAGEAPVKRRRTKRRNLVKTLFFSLIALVIIGIGALHVIPLRNIAVKVEHALSAWLHDDVSIASITFRLVPTPHLRVENVSVGKLLDAKATNGRVYLDIFTVFGDKVSLNSIELDNVSLSNEAVRRIPMWGNPEGKTTAGGIDSIKLRAVKLDVKPAIDPFDAQLTFGRDGTFKQARLTGSAGWTLNMAPGAEKGMDLTFNARNWTLPAGAPIPVSDVVLKGTLAGNEIIVPEFEASTMEGKVNGTLRVTWGSGVKLESDLSLAKVLAKDLVAVFTKAIAVTGKLDGNFTVVSEGGSVETLFDSPRASGKFRIAEGSISNIDLVAVMQSDTAGQRAGVTKFAELSGEYAGAAHQASYKAVSLQGGVLRGNGVLDIGANSALNGRLALEIRSQVAQDRGAFSVTGTVSRPIVRRGG